MLTNSFLYLLLNQFNTEKTNLNIFLLDSLIPGQRCGLLIATQNPIYFAGRSQDSSAIAHRQMKQVFDLSPEDVHAIVRARRPSVSPEIYETATCVRDAMMLLPPPSISVAHTVITATHC